MTIDVQILIERYPHLEDPLQFYARWQRFQKVVSDTLAGERPTMTSAGGNGYPLSQVGALFDSFVSIFDLPAVEFSPLREALIAGKIDFLRLPSGELPKIDDLDCPEEELAKMLFLFTRPYLQALRDSYPLDGTTWEGGRCPLCSAQAALTSITEGPKRQLHCSWCGTVGGYRYLGCPACGSEDTGRFSTIEAEGEPGYRVISCSSCNSYLKAVEGPAMKKLGPDLADLASLPLDIVAQEKGLQRTAPNPIALKTMA